MHGELKFASADLDRVRAGLIELHGDGQLLRLGPPRPGPRALRDAAIQAINSLSGLSK